MPVRLARCQRPNHFHGPSVGLSLGRIEYRCVQLQHRHRLAPCGLYLRRAFTPRCVHLGRKCVSWLRMIYTIGLESRPQYCLANTLFPCPHCVENYQVLLWKVTPSHFSSTQFLFPGGGLTLNFVGPNDILAFITYAQDASNNNVIQADTSKWFLFGHSFGGSQVLYYMGNMCAANNCYPPIILGSPFSYLLVGLDPVTLDDFAGQDLPQPFAYAVFANTAITRGGVFPFTLWILTGAAGDKPFLILN